jgi:hypothetical protein
MFDAAQIHEHARLLQTPESLTRHIVSVVPIDCSQVGWATSGSSGGEAGRFDLEGNGLIFAPSWSRAKDRFVSNPWVAGTKGFVTPQIHIFLNTKDSPGLPFRILPALNAPFGEFAAICCNFTRFYAYVSIAASDPLGGTPGPAALLVLKGIDLFGIGSPSRSTASEVGGCYSCGEGSEA